MNKLVTTNIMALKKQEDFMNGEVSEKKSASRVALPQILAVTVKNILLLAFGLTLGYPTILIPGLSDPKENFLMTTDELSWIGSINLICVPIGCIISGTISQKIGRRRAMQIVNIPFVSAWMLFRFATAKWEIFLALALTGFTGGFLEAPVITYVAEISQPHLRGMLSSTSTMAVIFGVLIMFLFGTFFHWRTVALICCIFNVLSFAFLYFVPESPHWLISKNRLLDARKSLAWLRGWTTLDEIEPEYKQIYRDVSQSENDGVDNPAFDGNLNAMESKKATKVRPQKTKLETIELFTKKNFLWPYTLVTFVFFLTHFCGMTTIQTYAIQIFESLHAPIDKYYATVILGLVELLGTIVCVSLVHYAGKRLLNFVSLLCISVCLFITATYAYFINVNNLVPSQEMQSNLTSSQNLSMVYEDTSGYETYSWLPLGAIIVSAFISHIGIRVLPWTLTGEVFSNETRSTASGMCSATSYILSFFANKTFFSMIDFLTLPGTFLFYSAVAFAGFVILYVTLPETEGKTLSQIEEHFSGGQKMGNHVFRGEKPAENPLQLGNVNNGYSADDVAKFENKL